MGDIKNIFDSNNKKIDKELINILPYINSISSEINDGLNNPNVEIKFFIYLLQDRIIKMFDFT